MIIIIPIIESDPLIFTKSLETQLQYLIFEPLRQLHRNFPLTCVVLLFDGVDECSGNENQKGLVRSITNFLSSRDIPVIAFFGSHAEYQLQQIFQSQDITTNLLQLALDDHYLPDDDIRLFLDVEFTQIKNTHPFRWNLHRDWPDPVHIEEIVYKLSGQFVYTSVVMKFLSSSHQHPAQQLEIVRGLRPAGYLTPFAQLDVLYRHIFSQVVDIDRTFFILVWAIFSTKTGWGGAQFERILAMSSHEVSGPLAGLASILTYRYDTIQFLHASLPDFLLDQTRSQWYYLDKRFWCTRLSIHCCCRIYAKIDMGK